MLAAGSVATETEGGMASAHIRISGGRRVTAYAHYERTDSS